MSDSRFKISKPCQESWDDMSGAERARFCGKCQKQVHDISTLTETEANELFDATATPPCVRYFPDESGAPIFRGSPAWLKLAAAGAFISVSGSGCGPAPAEPVMGAMPNFDRPAEKPQALVGETRAPYQLGRVAPEPKMGRIVQKKP